MSAALRSPGRRRRMAVVGAFIAVVAVWSVLLRAEEAPELGRLFFAPEQRHELDRQRQREPGAGATMTTAGSTPVLLNGVLRRPHGAPVVWVNGAARAGATEAGPPDAQNRVTVRAPDGKAVARLKPGQAWDPVSGAIRDCVQCMAPPVAGPASVEPSAADAVPASATPPPAASAQAP